MWFNYCNFRCPWCQNAHVVNGTESKEVLVKDIISEVEKASILIDYVQATGGEPTLQPDGLKALLESSKEEAGVKTSLSTNGSRSEVIKGLMENGLLDHVAIDVKAPIIDLEKYGRVAGIDRHEAEKFVNGVRASIELAVEETSFMELRTTLVPTLLSKEDVIEIATEIKDRIKDEPKLAYVIQQFVPSETLIDPNFAAVERTPVQLLMEVAGNVKHEVGLRKVYIRTKETGTVKV